MNEKFRFLSPLLIEKKHDRKQFNCESEALNIFLKEHAFQNNKNNISRTYVSICENNGNIAGYYSLSYGSISHNEATEKVKKRMPKYPIPVMLLARLAVDHRFKGFGLGRSLLKDALLRTMQASNIAGLKAIIAHAKDEKAKSFYLKYGFEESVLDQYHLMLPIGDLQLILDTNQN